LVIKDLLVAPHSRAYTSNCEGKLAAVVANEQNILRGRRKSVAVGQVANLLPSIKIDAAVHM